MKRLTFLMIIAIALTSCGDKDKETITLVSHCDSSTFLDTSYFKGDINGEDYIPLTFRKGGDGNYTFVVANQNHFTFKFNDNLPIREGVFKTHKEMQMCIILPTNKGGNTGFCTGGDTLKSKVELVVSIVTDSTFSGSLRTTMYNSTFYTDSLGAYQDTTLFMHATFINIPIDPDI